MRDLELLPLSGGSVPAAALQRVFRRRAPVLRALLAIAFGGGGSGGTIQTVTGVSPLALANALAKPLRSLIQYGKCVTENGDIYCNNGVLRMVDDELPAGHTRLQYIESDGTSESGGHVQTGIVINSVDVDVEVDFQYTETSASSPRMAWGYMAGSSNIPRWGFGIYSNAWLGSPNATAARNSIDTNRHVAITSVYVKNGTSYYSGSVDSDVLYTDQALQNVASFENNELPLILFGRNNRGTAGNFAPVKIFGFKVTKAGVVTHDLVPCKNDLGVLGYFDLKTSTFLPGTGTLTAGPADYSHAHVGVVGTPEELTISATGETTQTVNDIPDLFATLDGTVRDEVDLVSGVLTRRTEPVYENGAIVITALAEPYTEQATPHELHSYAGDTTVSWTAAVSGTTKTVEYAQGESGLAFVPSGSDGLLTADGKIFRVRS